mgnify:CR=1 FL=1
MNHFRRKLCILLDELETQLRLLAHQLVHAYGRGIGFVAGIRAGKAYNTFPLMNGHLVPPEIWLPELGWLNLFNNMATVQFDHRLGAWLLAFMVAMVCGSNAVSFGASAAS